MRQASLKKAPETGEMRKLINSLYSRINKVKVPKIELNEIQPEPKDPHVVVDDKPVEIETPQPVKVEAFKDPIKE